MIKYVGDVIVKAKEITATEFMLSFSTKELLNLNIKLNEDFEVNNNVYKIHDNSEYRVIKDKKFKIFQHEHFELEQEIKNKIESIVNIETNIKDVDKLELIKQLFNKKARELENEIDRL